MGIRQIFTHYLTYYAYLLGVFFYECYNEINIKRREYNDEKLGFE